MDEVRLHLRFSVPNQPSNVLPVLHYRILKFITTLSYFCFLLDIFVRDHARYYNQYIHHHEQHDDFLFGSEVICWLFVDILLFRQGFQRGPI